MNLYEIFFNSMAFFIITLPLILVIITAILQFLIKNKMKVFIIVFIIQVILYYGYSYILRHMRITDVYLDYVGFITIYTLVFGFIGTIIGNFVLSFLRKPTS